MCIRDIAYIYMGRQISGGSYAFGKLESFKVTIGNSVTSIESSVFSGCSGLTSIDIPNSVTSIGDWTFDGCRGLASIDIPNSVTSIGECAFYGCSDLTSIEIPNSVITIGKNAFEGCKNLNRAEFASIESLCKIEFESYSSNPLYYAHNLYIDGTEITKLLIPNTVETIESYTFRNCAGLISLEIPNSVTTIGSYAFSGCNGLKDVYYAATRPTNDASENIFDNSTYSSATLWVPQEAIEVCLRISPWRNFYDIKPYDFATGVEDVVFSPEEGYEDEMKGLTEVFTLEGVKVSEIQENLSPGVYVIRQGSETKKIVVK